jgi:hypothetical protein
VHEIYKLQIIAGSEKISFSILLTKDNVSLLQFTDMTIIRKSFHSKIIVESTTQYIQYVDIR